MSSMRRGVARERKPAVVRQQIDIAPKPFIVNEYHRHTYWCPACQSYHTAPEPEEARSGLFSISLIAFAAYLKRRCHISFSALKHFGCGQHAMLCRNCGAGPEWETPCITGMPPCGSFIERRFGNQGRSVQYKCLINGCGNAAGEFFRNGFSDFSGNIAQIIIWISLRFFCFTGVIFEQLVSVYV